MISDFLVYNSNRNIMTYRIYYTSYGVLKKVNGGKKPHMNKDFGDAKVNVGKLKKLKMYENTQLVIQEFEESSYRSTIVFCTDMN